MVHVRRIVTGHDAHGRSIIARDGATPRVLDPLGGGALWHEIWHAKAVPARIDRASAEPEEPKLSLHPPHSGARIRVVEFAPGAGGPADVDPAQVRGLFSLIDAADASTYAPGKPVGIHRTESLDFGIVLEGEISLVMDEGETLCRAGDIIVQNGTNHAWVNKSDKLARICFVLVDGKFEDGLTFPA